MNLQQHDENTFNSRRSLCTEIYFYIGTPAPVQERHYAFLEKEQKKKNPNQEVLHKYLKIEFQQRRQYIKSVPADERVEKIFSKYSSLKHHIQVLPTILYFKVKLT